MVSNLCHSISDSVQWWFVVRLYVMCNTKHTCCVFRTKAILMYDATLMQKPLRFITCLILNYFFFLYHLRNFSLVSNILQPLPLVYNCI